MRNYLPPLLCIPWQKEQVQVNEEQETQCCSTRAHNVIVRTCWLLRALFQQQI